MPSLLKKKRKCIRSFGDRVLFLADTYAWIEYLIGSERGRKVKELLKDERNIFFTLECCLAELKGWCLKENKDFKKLYDIVVSNSTIISIETSDWIRAAEIRFAMRKRIKDFGLIDSLLLAKQEKLGCKLLTGDKHFKGLNNVVFI